MNNGKSRWLLWLAGVVMFLLITALTTIGTNVIANDRASRERDEILGEKLHETELETRDRFEAIMVELAKINAKLEK